MTEIELKTIFLSFDKDNSGDLDTYEWTEFCNSLEINVDQREQIFHLLDTHKSGRIHLEDFLCAFKTVADIQHLSPPRSPAIASNAIPEDSTSCLRTKLFEFSSKSSTDEICEYHPPNVHSPVVDGEFFGHQLSDITSEVFGKDSDVVELITKESQNHVCELYQVLNSDYPLLIEPFKAIICDFVRSIRNKQDEHDSLETVYKKEREFNKSQMQYLENELETEMQVLEEKVRAQEQQKLQSQYSSLIAQKEKALSEMRERLQQLQQLEEEVAKDPNAFLETELKDRMASLTEENQNLRQSLVEVENRLGSIKTEVYELKKEMATKSSEVHQEKSLLYNYIREQDKLTEQLHLLNDANRRLHDKNDDLRSALEVASTPTHNSSLRRLDDTLSSGVHEMDSGLRDYEGDPDGEQNDRDPETHVLTRGQRSVSQTHPSDYYRLGRTPLFSEDEEEEGELSSNRDQRYPPEGSGHFIPIGSAERSSSLAALTYNPLGQKHHASPPDSRMTSEAAARKRWSAMDFSGFFGVQRGPGGAEEERGDGAHSGCGSPPLTESVISGSTQMPGSSSLLQLDTPERMYKVVLAGDSGVGKTSFIHRLCRQEFAYGLSATLGVDFQTKTLNIDGRLFAIQLWDTAGQERFRSISKSYFRRADGVILMFDCSFEKSFLNIRSWIDTVHQETEADVPILLVGNKTDLREKRRSDGATVIDWVDGWRLAESYRSLFIETSAKDNYNVDEALVELARVLQNKEDFEVSKIRVGYNNNNHLKKTKRLGCCK